MNTQFIDWANGISLGSAIIIGSIVIGCIAYLVRTIHKVGKMYKDYVLTEHEKSESDKKIHDTVQQLQDSMTNIEMYIKSSFESNAKRMSAMDESIAKFAEQSSNTATTVNKIDGIVSLLVESDKDAIKAYILEQYEKFSDLGYIDMLSYETIQCRYNKYKQEHGNSFVDGLMAEIEKLPKRVNKYSHDD